MVACSKLFIVVPFYRHYIIQHSSPVRREPGSICAVIILRRKKNSSRKYNTNHTHKKSLYTYCSRTFSRHEITIAVFVLPGLSRFPHWNYLSGQALWKTPPLWHHFYASNERSENRTESMTKDQMCDKWTLSFEKIVF